MTAVGIGYFLGCMQTIRQYIEGLDKELVEIEKSKERKEKSHDK